MSHHPENVSTVREIVKFFVCVHMCLCLWAGFLFSSVPGRQEEEKVRARIGKKIKVATSYALESFPVRAPCLSNLKFFSLYLPITQVAFNGLLIVS